MLLRDKDYAKKIGKKASELAKTYRVDDYQRMFSSKRQRDDPAQPICAVCEKHPGWAYFG